MPQFAYKAMQHDGVLTEGFLDANNRHEAMRQVESRGLRPIKLAESVVAPAKHSSTAHPSDKTAASGGAAPSAGFTLSLGGKPKITPRMRPRGPRMRREPPRNEPTRP